MSAIYRKTFKNFGKEVFGCGEHRAVEAMAWFFQDCKTFPEARSYAEEGYGDEDLSIWAHAEDEINIAWGRGEDRTEIRWEAQRTAQGEYEVFLTYEEIEWPSIDPITLCHEQAGWELWTEEMQIAEHYRSLEWQGHPDVICRICRLFPALREEIASARKDLHLEP